MRYEKKTLTTQTTRQVLLVQGLSSLAIFHFNMTTSHMKPIVNFDLIHVHVDVIVFYVDV